MITGHGEGTCRLTIMDDNDRRSQVIQNKGRRFRKTVGEVWPCTGPLAVTWRFNPPELVKGLAYLRSRLRLLRTAFW